MCRYAIVFSHAVLCGFRVFVVMRFIAKSSESHCVYHAFQVDCSLMRIYVYTLSAFGACDLSQPMKSSYLNFVSACVITRHARNVHKIDRRLALEFILVVLAILLTSVSATGTSVMVCVHPQLCLYRYPQTYDGELCGCTTTKKSATKT